MATLSNSSLDVSPPIHRCQKDVKTIDKSLFQRQLNVLAVRVPASRTGAMLRADEMKGYFNDTCFKFDDSIDIDVSVIMNLPKIRTVVPGSSDDNERLILLRVSRQGVFPH